MQTPPHCGRPPRTRADAPHRGQPHHRGRCQGGRRSRGHWSPEGLSRVGFCKRRGVGGQISAVSEHTSLLPVSVLFREAPGVSLPFLFEEVRPRFLKASPLIHGCLCCGALEALGLQTRTQLHTPGPSAPHRGRLYTCCPDPGPLCALPAHLCLRVPPGSQDLESNSGPRRPRRRGPHTCQAASTTSRTLAGRHRAAPGWHL